MQNIPVEMNITRRIESPVKESFASCAFLYVSEGEILISAGGEPILHSRPGLVFLPPGREVLLQSARDISSVLILGIGEAFLFDHLKASPLPFLSSFVRFGKFGRKFSLNIPAFLFARKQAALTEPTAKTCFE